MSFILDALKKSETERQQQSPAEFATVPSGTSPSGMPRWLWVVGLLLLINLAVLVGVLLRPGADTPAIAKIPAVIEQPPASTSVESTTFSERVAAARQNRPGEQATPVAAVPATVPGGATPTDHERETVQPVLISQNPASISERNLYPSIYEVRGSLLRGMPELHLDIHVYNPDPADRFVFINMSKLREGSQLDEGPVVAEITPDGVVLGHQGQLFLLPRD